jgi:hypothetical protein
LENKVFDSKIALISPRKGGYYRFDKNTGEGGSQLHGWYSSDNGRWKETVLDTLPCENLNKVLVLTKIQNPVSGYKYFLHCEDITSGSTSWTKMYQDEPTKLAQLPYGNILLIKNNEIDEINPNSETGQCVRTIDVGDASNNKGGIGLKYISCLQMSDMDNSNRKNCLSYIRLDDSDGRFDGNNYYIGKFINLSNLETIASFSGFINHGNEVCYVKQSKQFAVLNTLNDKYGNITKGDVINYGEEIQYPKTISNYKDNYFTQLHDLKLEDENGNIYNRLLAVGTNDSLKNKNNIYCLDGGDTYLNIAWEIDNLGVIGKVIQDDDNCNILLATKNVGWFTRNEAWLQAGAAFLGFLAVVPACCYLSSYSGAGNNNFNEENEEEGDEEVISMRNSNLGSVMNEAEEEELPEKEEVASVTSRTNHTYYVRIGYITKKSRKMTEYNATVAWRLAGSPQRVNVPFEEYDTTFQAARCANAFNQSWGI